MRSRLHLILIFTACIGCSTATADVRFFHDESKFNARFPNLILEDFEDASRLGAGINSASVACQDESGSPTVLDQDSVSSASDDMCFRPGEIATGLTINGQRLEMVYGVAAGGGYANDNWFLRNFHFSKPIVLRFPLAGIHKFGVKTLGGLVTVKLFSENGTLIAEERVRNCDCITGQFIGARSSIPIRKVSIGLGSSGAAVDNVRFSKPQFSLTLSRPTGSNGSNNEFQGSSKARLAVAGLTYLENFALSAKIGGTSCGALGSFTPNENGEFFRTFTVPNIRTGKRVTFQATRDTDESKAKSVYFVPNSSRNQLSVSAACARLVNQFQEDG